MRKAIIPLAGRATRHRPASLAVPKGLFPLVDVDGRTKPVIQFILEEAFESGIELACLVTGPGEDVPYRQYFDALAGSERELASLSWAGALGRVHFAVQPASEGYGHAVLCGREFAAGEPVLVMLGDHVYRSAEGRRCAQQVVECFQEHGAATSAVQRTPETELHLFGTVRAEPVPGAARTYEVREIVEKPRVALAQERLRVSGLPEGHYLCWFGLHALTPAIFEVLADDVASRRRERGEYQLTGAQGRLAQRERYLGYEVAGRRFDMGDPAGLVATQAALAARPLLPDST